jgi:hypothetical protein
MGRLVPIVQDVTPLASPFATGLVWWLVAVEGILLPTIPIPCQILTQDQVKIRTMTQMIMMMTVPRRPL